MKINLSVAVNKETFKAMQSMMPPNAEITMQDLFGHIGTHFDLMDKTFDMSNLERRGIVFDVSGVEGREIEMSDFDITQVKEDDFVMFYTGTLKEKGYGNKEYFISHPELSHALIEKLVEMKVSMIGIDCGGIRMPADHPKADRYCADRNVFVVENLDNLDVLLHETKGKAFTVHTYPMNFTDASGLPCRVIADVQR